MSYDYTNYPLPPNWEQRFDRETKRFFFIDHFAKVTSWIDPRIELYNIDIQESDLTNESECSSTNSAEFDRPSTKEINPRVKKAAELHQKFPNFSLVKIEEYLNENFDNVSSVEFKLKRELQLIEQKEKEETRKRIEENAKKIEKEEREKQKKVETMPHKATQESKRKIKEETKTGLAKNHEQGVTKIENKEQSGKNEINTSSEIKQVTSDDKSESQVRVGSQKMPTKANVEITDYTTTNVENIQKIKTKSNIGPDQMNYHGSDPKNHLGHNADLLSSNRKLLAKGPNPAIRTGPQNFVTLKITN